MTIVPTIQRDELQSLIDTVPNPVLVKNRRSQIVMANDAACAFLRYPREVLLRCSDALMPEDQQQVFHAADEHVFRTGEIHESEETITDGSGRIRHAITRKRRLKLPDEELLVAVITDVTALRETEERNRYLALHDALTGLPNRVLLNERIDQALLRAARAPGSCALLYIDLDRFKDVNDRLGHPAGDRLLIAFAQRLTTIARASDTVARLGGDEFAILLTGIGDGFDPSELCTRIVAAAAAPFDVDGQRVFVGTSVGVALVPDDIPDGAELHRRADIALYEAKGAGRNCFRVFREELDERSRRRATLESDLRDALEAGVGIEVHYQPVIGQGGRLVAMEALVRWTHPVLGVLQPAEFVPVAEECGLIAPLGEYVLTQAAMMLAPWRNVELAVNLSPVQLRTPGIVERLLAIVDAAGLERSRLQLEVTETALFGGHDMVAQIRALRAAGVQVVLDDFGTGYSSLSHLQRLEVDRVKIDRSFVRGLGHTEDSRAIVEAVLAIGRTLGIAITAEGVETAAQLQFLSERGCAELQGYFFSRPLNARAARAYLSAERTARAA